MRATARARAFLKRDHRQPVEKVIQYLLPFGCRLLGDPVANLRGRREDAAVVSDLCKPA